jgi:hypothetical protein
MSPDSAPFNPYAPPRAEPASPAPSEMEKVRHELLGHEAGFQGVGGAYLLVGMVSLLFGMLSLLIGWQDPRTLPMQVLRSLGPGICMVLAALLLFWLAYGLRNLNERSRKSFFVFGLLGLLVFPIGTMVNGYLLYLLLSVKGKRVLSPEYRQVIAATPHIRYKSPWILGVVIVGTAIAIPVLIIYLAVNSP